LLNSNVGFFSKIDFFNGDYGNDNAVHPEELFLFDNIITVFLNFKFRIKFYPIICYFFVNYFFLPMLGSFGFLLVFIIYSFWNVDIIKSFLL